MSFDTVSIGRQRVLLTGASGFIGRACIAPLQQRGFEVHAVATGEQPVRAGVHWHRLDLLDSAATAALIDSLRPSHLLHLAWCAKPGEFWTSEENFLWVTASQQMFRAFYTHGGERALGVGTCAEYQWVAEDCNELSTPLHPDSLYGRCKLATCLILEAAAAVGGGSAAWARLFLPYGPGEPVSRFIPAIVRGLLSHRGVPCSHGNQVRDLLFVDDAAAGLVALLCATATGAFNLGTGRATSLRQVADRVVARLGQRELLQFGARQAPPGDPQRVVADMSRTIAATGWQPAVDLEQGIDHTIAGWRQQLSIEEQN